MATSKEIRSRIGSVSNTKKITRTMELVSTAKAKKAVDKVVASRPYADKIRELIGSLAAQGEVADHPLLRKHSHVRRALVVIVTANRGLCGGYNANALRTGISVIDEYKRQNVEVIVHLIGKKAVSFFNYQKFLMQRLSRTSTTNSALQMRRNLPKITWRNSPSKLSTRSTSSTQSISAQRTRSP
jgi:F-type H+-transporting ATPase subunit gamma